MQLVSLSFIYLFLPVCLAVYYLAPRRLRPAALLCISLLYYGLAAPDGLPLLIASVCMDFAALRVMSRFARSRRARRGCMWFSIVKNVVLLLWAVLLRGMQGPALLGVGVYCLSGIDCLVASARDEAPFERGFVRFGLYCCFFPRLYQGPLLSCQDFSSRLNSGMRFSFADLLRGLAIMLFGMFKLLIPASYLGTIFQTLRDCAPEEVTVLSAWTLALTLALSVYYSLSGYCDIARGVGVMCGITLPRNFYYPYQSRGVLDFFERFLSTVSAFLRRLFPARPDEHRLAGGARILAAGLMMGVWTGRGTGHVLWGLFLALVALLERYVYPGVLRRIPPLFIRLYTFLLVLVSFAVYAGETPGQSLMYLNNLVNVSSALYNNRILYLLATNWLLLLLSLFFATNVCSLLLSALRRALPRAFTVLTLAADCALLLLVTAQLMPVAAA